MSYDLYDYVDSRGVNDIKTWAESLETVQRAKLQARLDQLELHGPALYPEMLSGTGTPGISKLRIKGNVQLRPMLCHGPINHHKEFTLLLGAIEKGSKLKPKNADKIADGRKSEVISDNTRRKTHERVN